MSQPTNQFALVTRRPYCPGGPKKLCFTTLSLVPMVSIARLSVVKQSIFGLPGQYGRRVTRVNHSINWSPCFTQSVSHTLSVHPSHRQINHTIFSSFTRLFLSLISLELTLISMAQVNFYSHANMSKGYPALWVEPYITSSDGSWAKHILMDCESISVALKNLLERSQWEETESIVSGWRRANARNVIFVI